MQITVNGTPRDISEGSSLTDLLKQLNLNIETTIVELNRDVVAKTDYNATALTEGDILELVRLVGGG
jgi:thiamine biosynthesis protein ThiS